MAKAEKEQIRPDALAAMRLAEHVLAAEGKDAFVDAFVNECFKPLDILGLLDAANSLSDRALEMVEKNSEEEATVIGNLGLIYRRRGELNKAEEMHKNALKIDKKLGCLVGMAIDYGNLGNVFKQRGDIDKARNYWEKSLDLFKKIGMQTEVEKTQGWIDGIDTE